MPEPVCCRWCGQDFEATKAVQAENARLHGLLQNSEMTVAEVIDANEQLKEALRSEGANRYWEGRWRDEFADNTRLRELLRGVIREADRETNAFIAARAAIAYDPERTVLKEIGKQQLQERREAGRLRELLTEIINYFEGGIMPLDLRDWRERSIKALGEQAKEQTHDRFQSADR
jgi:hypothetical protein